MLVLETPATMRAWATVQRAAGRRIGLVPTMGALHEGHLALIGAAAHHADVVVVSIFVNQLQFNRPDDFTLYPRPIDDDLARCREAGVAVVYAPTQPAMYPRGFETFVVPGALADPLEGAGRPGHFRGVTTVVTKLFNAVTPDVAVFGRKDYQQLAVITRMVADLDMSIEIIGAPTVRERDGLALSSRNRRLDTAQRGAAVVVVAALDAMEAAIAGGQHNVAEIHRIALAVVADEPLAKLEYAEVVDPSTLAQLRVVEREVLAVIAVWFGDVRLIDNRSIIAPAQPVLAPPISPIQ